MAPKMYDMAVKSWTLEVGNCNSIRRSIGQAFNKVGKKRDIVTILNCQKLIPMSYIILLLTGKFMTSQHKTRQQPW